MNKSVVSIIMPVYGVERYIAKAIRSVQSQTYIDWELIVVNDGTKDKSRDIAESFAKSDSRIKIVDKQNGGLSDARNVGLAHASGEYVLFFDSDDWLEPSILSKLVRKLKVSDADFVVCGYYIDFVDDEGNELRSIVKDSIPTNAKSAGEYFDLMERYMNFAWNKLYRHDFLRQHNLLFEKGLWLIEDCEFMSRVLQCKPKISYLPFAGYHYIQRPESTLSKAFNNQVIEFMRRKMSLYKPYLSSLGASEEVATKIYEDMRAYTSVYLIKKMGKSLGKDQFISQVQILYTDKLLDPAEISLKNCKTKPEFVIISLAKLRLFGLIHYCLNK